MPTRRQSPRAQDKTIDQLHDGVAAIFAREKALAPLAAEYAEINAAAEALRQAGFDDQGNLDSAGGVRAPASQPRAAAAPRRRRRSRTRGGSIARKGERAEQLLEYVREHPGLTTMQLADQLGLTVANVQFQVRKLIDSNQLMRDRNRELHVIDDSEQASTSRKNSRSRRSRSAQSKPGGAAHQTQPSSNGSASDPTASNGNGTSPQDQMAQDQEPAPAEA